LGDEADRMLRIQLAQNAFKKCKELQLSLINTRCAKRKVSYRGTVV
jgi:hypothetical protein